MGSEAGKTDDGIAGVFGRAAAAYDGIGRFSHFGERLVELAQLALGVSVLDVAAGCGALTFPAAKRVGPHGRVIGIDITPEMLRETAKDVRSEDRRNVELRQMDAEQLQFQDGAFDWVLCGFALWFFPHPHRALQQFYRVLRPGGRLGLSTWAQDSPIHKLNRETLRPHLTPSSKADGAAETQRFDTKEQLETALREAGFEDARIVAEDYEAIVAGVDPLWEEQWSTGTRRNLERMPASTLEAFKADYYKKLESLRQPDGIHAVYRALLGFATK
jgi:ubiquinone/menaquinone biosynthesis C-methylase UbiE